MSKKIDKVIEPKQMKEFKNNSLAAQNALAGKMITI